MKYVNWIKIMLRSCTMPLFGNIPKDIDFQSSRILQLLSRIYIITNFLYFNVIATTIDVCANHNDIIDILNM